MFREFVDNKILRETEQFKDINTFSKEIIKKSEVSDFTKNYLNYYLTEEIKAEDISSMIGKANKLYFNYALRPKWTLVNFLFNNFESRSPAEILKKLKLFPFYKYYTDAVSDFINDNSMIFITKTEIENIIDRTNQAIHSKLTVDITGQKIKNVFLQLFILNDFNEENYNLESVIPFSFIKIFLSDKDYPELLSKFDALNGKSDEENIPLKDIIKVLTGRFSSQDTAAETGVSGSSDTLKPAEKASGISIEKIDTSDKKIINESNSDITERSETDKKEKEIKSPVSDNKIKAVEKAGEQSDGFVIKQKIEIAKDVPPVKSENSDYKTVSPDAKETGSSNLENPISENTSAKAKTLEIPLKDSGLVPASEDFDNKEIEKENVKQKNIDFKELFSEKELDSILNRVYNSNLMARQRSFEKLNSYKTWFEAFNHLKEIFKNNKVDIYHKDVIRYVDALNEHFQDKE